MKSAKMRVFLQDVMGSDLSVVNAARVSFDKEHITIDELSLIHISEPTRPY